MKRLLLLIAVYLSVSLYAVAGNRVLFSPGGNIQAEIIQLIAGSNKTIDVMIYSFTAQEIAGALISAKDRGVKVRVIADKSQSKGKSSLVGYLISRGLDVKISSGRSRGIMHNKVGIFDGLQVITGSYNWTKGAELYNYENALVTDDLDTIGKYQKEFNRLWGK